MLQPAGSTERCALLIIFRKKACLIRLLTQSWRQFGGILSFTSKKKPGNFGCNKLNPAVTTSVGHADLVDSVGQRCMVSFVWPHPSMRGQRWWQFGLAKREPDGGWVARAGTSSDSDSPDKLQVFSCVYSNHELCAYGRVSLLQPTTYGMQLNQIPLQYSSLEYPLHSIT